LARSDIKALIQELFAAAAAFKKSRGYPAPKLYPGASAAEIEAAEKKRKIKFPGTFTEFLGLHNGFDGFWGDYSLIGVKGEHTKKALAFIKMLVEIDTDERELSSERAIKKYESEGEFYLPNYPIVGTDFGSSIILFNPRKTRPDGEMEVVFWSPEGSPFTRYGSFAEMIQAAIVDQKRRAKTGPGRTGKGHEQ